VQCGVQLTQWGLREVDLRHQTGVRSQL
jgi:hypothetical protein